MTISYSDRFARLLKRWKGSLWKTLFKDLVIYLMMYYIINIACRITLRGTENRARRQQMLKLQYLFNEYTKQIPLTFLLGFYVGMVVKRWWEQFKFISWPDGLLATMNAYIRGGEEERLKRLTVARYCLLSAVLAWRSISARVFKRFPTDQHLIEVHPFLGVGIVNSTKGHFEGLEVVRQYCLLDGQRVQLFSVGGSIIRVAPYHTGPRSTCESDETAQTVQEDDRSKAGLLTQEEREFMQDVEVTYDPHQKWFVPLGWVHCIFVKTYEERKLRHATELENLLAHLEDYKSGFQELFLYDWVSIPLVYTQVATIATYGYFTMCLIARQYPAWVSVPPLSVNAAKTGSKSEEPDFSAYEIDVFIPIFTILQFLFYVGWLKVGEDLMSPFGEDDEDFELNYMIDRHAEMSRIIVDTLHARLPQNIVFTDLPDYPLPHTVASAMVPYNGPKRHIQSLTVSASESQLATDSFLNLHSHDSACSPRHLLCVCDVLRAVTDCKGILSDAQETDAERQRLPVEDLEAKELAEKRPKTDDPPTTRQSSFETANPGSLVTVTRNHTV